MPGRTTLNQSGPRNYTAPAHESGVRPNNTVLNRLRVRRDTAGTANTSAQTYIPPNNLSGPLNDTYLAADLHQPRVRRNAAASNITSNGTISTNFGSIAVDRAMVGFGLLGALSLMGLGLVFGIVLNARSQEQVYDLRRHRRDVESSAIPLINIRSPGIEPPPYETLSNIPAAGAGVPLSVSATNVCLDEEPPPSYESIYPPASHASLEASASGSSELLPPAYSI